MKREIGISIYPDHSVFEQDKQYLEKAAKLGYTRLFMSMLEVGNEPTVVKNKFQAIIRVAKENGFEVCLDIAPSIFQQLNISYDQLDFFAELGADVIRLDEGFDGNREAMLTYNPFNLAIELNMSNNVAYLENILSYQANEPFLYGCHNFYPQRGTGLPYDFFVACSQRFKKHGIKTAAFVSSKTGNMGPWNVNDGLPTLEMHRDLPIAVQTKHLFATGLIDVVIIGNAYATDEELAMVAAVNRYKLDLTVLPVEQIQPIEETILRETGHFRRGDISNTVIRSTQVRVKYQDRPNPAHDNKQEFVVGDVVIGNDQFGRYKNELQIVLEAHQDERKNLVGRIPQEERFLLSFIQPWSKFGLTIQ